MASGPQQQKTRQNQRCHIFEAPQHGGVLLIRHVLDNYRSPLSRHAKPLSGRCAGGRVQGFGGGGAGVWGRGYHDGRDPRRGGDGDGQLLVPRTAWGLRG